MTAGPWLKRRRDAKKSAIRRYPNRQMEWIGGVLYFSDTKKAVPRVDRVPKDGRPILGIKALTS
jgi:hypothetical protein